MTRESFVKLIASGVLVQTRITDELAGYLGTLPSYPGCNFQSKKTFVSKLGDHAAAGQRREAYFEGEFFFFFWNTVVAGGLSYRGAGPFSSLW